MKDLIQTISNLSPTIILLIKITLVLTLTWSIHFSIKNVNPRWRVWLWRCTAVALLFIAAISFLPTKLNFQIVRNTKVDSSTNLADASHSILDNSQANTDENLMTRQPVFDVRDGTSQIEQQHQANGSAGNEPGIHKRSQSVEESQQLQFRPDWYAISFFTWLSVVTFLLLRLFIRLGRLKRMANEFPTANGKLIEAARQVASKIELKKLPRIAISRSLKSPCLIGFIGFRKACVVLPEEIAARASRDELEAIISHELAHFKERDFGWHAFINVISALLWFHPLAWKINSTHLNECESVSDDIAIGVTVDSDSYRRLLARIAINSTSDFATAGISMGRSASIV